MFNAALLLVVNFALWFSIIYFVFWCLKHFGII